jgi:deoxyribodipyrimidine photo-lyase
MPHSSTASILWFRQDLRLSDHPALSAALASHAIIPLYILDDEAAGAWAWGGAQRWWLHHSLAELNQALDGRLVIQVGRAEDILPRLADETKATIVHASAAYEPWARNQERRVSRALDPIKLQLHRGRTLFHPEDIRTQGNTPFGVYSPFMRACRARGVDATPLPAPAKIPTGTLPKSIPLDDLALLPTKPDWAGGLRAAWQPGEAAAQKMLTRFVDGPLPAYKDSRDHPAQPGTSALSPALHWGNISPLQVWHAAHQHPKGGKGVETFANELLWREFNINLLWHHPTMPDQPLRPQFKTMQWRTDQAGFAAWSRGQTGIPMVDAGMRQLWQTGWMHNRVRMITASFLIKHLLIDWVAGEKGFWDTLVDGDLASNSGNWQWTAGCGADAAPFFRIFNPVLQGLKFDPDGSYVRRFVPELARLDNRLIHAPWDAPALALHAAGIELGRTYPKPIIDLNEGRTRALAAFEAIKDPAAKDHAA